MDERAAVSKRVLPILAAAVAVAVFGAYSGYLAAEQFAGPPSSPSSPSNDVTAPPGPPVQVDVPSARKTPIPSKKAALDASELDYKTETFSVRTAPNPSVRVSLRAPRGWRFSDNAAEPQEVRFVDPTNERALRVESGFTRDNSTSDAMALHFARLKASQPAENDFRVLAEGTGSVVDTNGETRTVSTLTYTYIPNKTVRYVMIRWIATGGDTAGAAVEMSATGLPQDARALTAVLEEATRSVRRTD